MALRGTRSAEGALNPLRALGYETVNARPYDLDDIGLTGVGTRRRAHRRRGYGVLVSEVDAWVRDGGAAGGSEDDLKETRDDE
jgi:hypothetical protein